MSVDYINQLEELRKPNVHIKNPDKVNKIINQFVQSGFNKLHIVSDFDKTITKQHENGKTPRSSFAMFSKCPSLTNEYKEQSKSIAMKYIPIEVDPTIPQDKKAILMIDWWSQSEALLKGLKISPAEIDKVCLDLNPSLRTGTKKLFDFLHEHEVPVVVFSAGLGDMIVPVLKHSQTLLPNVQVISNFLRYDDTGTIQGFKDDMIHVFNKNEGFLRKSDFYHLIEKRTNVILMGDSLGDAAMCEGIPESGNVLKIGFLYERKEEALASYVDTFDIVLVDDQTMAVPLDILNCIKPIA